MEEVFITFLMEIVGNAIYTSSVDKNNIDIIVAYNYLVCYSPSGINTYEDIPQELVDKHFKEFEKPDKFYRHTNGEIVVINENKKTKDEIER